MQRRNEHLSKLRRNVHENVHLQRHYNKYGEDSFYFRMLEECEKELLTEREQSYIDKLTKNERFNINLIASKPPIPKKGRISENGLISLRNRIPWNKGKTLSDDHKQKISEACIGMKMPESQIIATRNRMTNRNVSLESRIRMRNAKSIFNEKECIEILELKNKGWSQNKIADHYNCSRGAIRNALRASLVFFGSSTEKPNVSY